MFLSLNNGWTITASWHWEIWINDKKSLTHRSPTHGTHKLIGIIVVFLLFLLKAEWHVCNRSSLVSYTCNLSRKSVYANDLAMLQTLQFTYRGTTSIAQNCVVLWRWHWCISTGYEPDVVGSTITKQGWQHQLRVSVVLKGKPASLLNWATGT